MESLEDKVLSSGCALGKQRSANNQCPSLGGRGRERAGNVCKGSLSQAEGGFCCVVFNYYGYQGVVSGLSRAQFTGTEWGRSEGARRHLLYRDDLLCVCGQGSPSRGKEGLRPSQPPSPPRGRISLKALSRVASL